MDSTPKDRAANFVAALFVTIGLSVLLVQIIVFIAWLIGVPLI